VSVRAPTAPEAVGVPSPSPVEHRCDQPAVRAQGLALTYPDGTHAVESVDLLAYPGEVVGVVGPNGAGKTSTLKILATLLAPTRGTATIMGHDVIAPARVRPLLGVALQDVGLDPLMTGRDHFEVQLALYGVARRDWARIIPPLVERFALAPFVDRTTGCYSVGMQRRLAIALSLVHDPRVVILDEPTAGLDPGTRRRVWQLVTDLKSDGKTVLLSTQYLEEADLLCDRVYLIDRGVVVLAGTPAELKRTLASDQVLRIATDLDSAGLVAAVAEATGVLGTADAEEARFAPATTEVVMAVARVCADRRLHIRRLALDAPGLDDVFLHFTGHDPTAEGLSAPRMDLTTRRARGAGKRWK
jgi:ABC-2 type transport system ATP-binding protein